MQSKREEKYLANLFNALQCHVCQHVGFNAAKEDVVIHLIHYLLILDTRSNIYDSTLREKRRVPYSPVKIQNYLLELVFITIHDADSQNQFLSIVVIEDAVEVVTKSYETNKD